jgi:hypothetical protein
MHFKLAQLATEGITTPGILICVNERAPSTRIVFNPAAERPNLNDAFMEKKLKWEGLSVAG